MTVRFRAFAHLAAMIVFAMLATGAAADAPFDSDKSYDYFGYYMPAKPVKMGPWRLHDLFIGAPDDFRSFERHASPRTFAAVMLEFDDVTSPQKRNEMGEPYHTRSIRILPTTYVVGPYRVHFEGKDAKLGVVGFDGTFDKQFLVDKASAGNDGSRTILSGKLVIAGAPYRASFYWFAGD